MRQPFLADTLGQSLQCTDTIGQPVQLCVADLVEVGIARLDIGGAQQLVAALAFLRVASPEADQPLVELLAALREEVETMRLGPVEFEHQKDAVVGALGGLMQLKGRLIPPFGLLAFVGFGDCFCAGMARHPWRPFDTQKVVIKIGLPLGARFLRRQGYRLGQRKARLLKQRDPFLDNIDEKIAPAFELVVGVVQAVDDEIERLGPEAARQHLDHPVFGLRPIFRRVGEIYMIDDGEDVLVREIAPDRIDYLASSGIGAEEDDLEDLAVADVRRGAPRGSPRKFLAQDFNRLRQVASCPCGKMGKVGLESSGHRRIFVAARLKRKGNVSARADKAELPFVRYDIRLLNAALADALPCLMQEL